MTKGTTSQRLQRPHTIPKKVDLSLSRVLLHTPETSKCSESKSTQSWPRCPRVRCPQGDRKAGCIECSSGFKGNEVFGLNLETWLAGVEHLHVQGSVCPILGLPGSCNTSAKDAAESLAVSHCWPRQGRMRLKRSILSPEKEFFEQVGSQT